MATPRFITALQKQTGTTRSEAITVLSIAILLAAGTIGPWIFSTPSLHEVATADRVLAILDSMQKASSVPGNEQTSDGSNAWSKSNSGYASSGGAGYSSSRGGSSAKSSGSPARGSVNINTASAAQLERLPGVGPATAQAIIKRRTLRPFMHVDDLMDIRGIGPKKLEKMKEFVVCKPAK